MRLANSAYYGLSGRVRTVTFAVTVLGFTTVRSLALTAAAGVGGGDPVPPGFWRRSACTAVAAGELARPLGLHAPDAFCLGLLSGIGQALLHHADPAGYAALAEAAPDRQAPGRWPSGPATAPRTSRCPPPPCAPGRSRPTWPPRCRSSTGGRSAVRPRTARRPRCACSWPPRWPTASSSPGPPPQDVRHMTGGRVQPGRGRRAGPRVPELAADLVRAVTG